MADEIVEKNSNIELLLGDHKTAIKKLAWPMMVSMFLVMAYNLADGVWVAGLGADALAAVGFITPLFMILVGLGNGVGAGVNSLVARFIGSDNYKQANNTALHSLVLTVIISIVGAVVMCLALPTILDVMGAGSATQTALDYGYIVFGCMIVFIYSNVGTAILRSEGDVKRAMYAMAVTAIINIILDPIMIYTLGMGISGAAWATVISAAMSCLILLYWIHYKKDTYLDLTLSNYKTDRKIITGILNIAIPSTAENLIFSILGIIENWLLVTTAGTAAVAAYTAALRLIQIANIPIMGLGTALITVAGAAYGEKDYTKFDKSFKYTMNISIIVTFLLVIIFYIFTPQICSLFSSGNTQIISYITDATRYLLIFMVFQCFSVIPCMLFQSVGKGTTSLILSLWRSIILKVIFTVGVFAILLNNGFYSIYNGYIMSLIFGGIVAFMWALRYIRKLKKSDDTITI